MGTEFTKVGPNAVVSSAGYEVQIQPPSGVMYKDREGEVRVNCEYMVKPPGIVLYRRSPSKRGFDQNDEVRAATIFTNLTRALQFLGHQVETS